MRTNKAFAALCSALFAGSLAFAPALTSQAAAAPKPAQTITDQQNDYRQGNAKGFRIGFADAKDDCARESGRNDSGYGFSRRGRSQTQKDYDYTRGYGDGYESGYSRAYARFC